MMIPEMFKVIVSVVVNRVIFKKELQGQIYTKLFP